MSGLVIYLVSLTCQAPYPLDSDRSASRSPTSESLSMRVSLAIKAGTVCLRA